MPEHRCIAGLAGTDEHDQRSPVPVDQLVDLRRQAPAGPAQCVITGLDQQIPVVRSRPPVTRVSVAPCWWARMIVESMLTAQSTSPAASASANSAARTWSQVPSPL